MSEVNFDINEFLSSRKDNAILADTGDGEASDHVELIDAVIFGVRNPRWRTLLVLRYINGFTIREIAERYSVSRRTIRRQMREALRASEVMYKELFD